MAKTKTVFYCTSCGNETPKWMGRCPGCGAFNTMEEHIEKPVAVGKAKSAPVGSSRIPKRIREVTSDGEIRFSTGMGELDRVLGGGAVAGSLVLVGGAPGIGKSTLFARLGGKWFSDSLTIGDMKDKSAAEKLQGYWILELGELAGIRKVDVETVKSFITRTDDKFRQSYGTTVESHPRNNIIVGSTNSESGFLRDITGNRRFWPVAVAGGSKYSVFSLTQQVLDQIWAEAIELYRGGESLTLSDELADMAYAQQQAAMEADDREGIVLEYLERLLPENWDSMDLYQRRSYLGESEFAGAQHKGTVHRERVCIMEIWCECFGKERQNLKRSDSFEIEAILNRIGGWHKITTSKTGKMHFQLYGPQKAFLRHSDNSTGTC